LKNNINQITFYFAKEGPGRRSDDIKKNVTVASAKPRELQTIAHFSPASTFLITNISVSKVTIFLVLFALLLQKRTICLSDVCHG
jgi:hypothetical protein